MPRIRYESITFELDNDRSLLEGLEDRGFAIPFSCRQGNCQTCLMRAVAGTPPATAQRGLKSSLIQQNFLLSCICHPDADLEVTLPDVALFNQLATIAAMKPLCPHVMEVHLLPEKPFQYFSGQFIHLKLPERGIQRSYSLASYTELDQSLLVLHIRIYPEGQMSSWFDTEARVGDTVQIAGPFGDCIYTEGQPEQPMLMVGTGTGLAPLYGVLRHALHAGHTGPIHLYHGSHLKQGLYLHDLLNTLARKWPQLHYYGCTSGENPTPDTLYGRADAMAITNHPDLKGWRVYLCGQPDMVKQMRRNAFLAGAKMQDIHMDAFA